MKVKTLSVRNPQSYLICTGIKDVENRSWSTDYRGELYIHSSGRQDYDRFLADDFPDVFLEYFKFKVDVLELLEDKEAMAAMSASITRALDALRVFIRETWMKHYQALVGAEIDFEKFSPLLRARAIIGKVTLSDVVEDADSPFAEPGSKHWLLTDAELFSKPILYVKGRLRLWEYDIGG